MISGNLLDENIFSLCLCRGAYREAELDESNNRKILTYFRNCVEQLSDQAKKGTEFFGPFCAPPDATDSCSMLWGCR